MSSKTNETFCDNNNCRYLRGSQRTRWPKNSENGRTQANCYSQTGDEDDEIYVKLVADRNGNWNANDTKAGVDKSENKSESEFTKNDADNMNKDTIRNTFNDKSKDNDKESEREDVSKKERSESDKSITDSKNVERDKEELKEDEKKGDRDETDNFEEKIHTKL